MEEPKLKPQLKLVALYYLGECAGNAEKSAVRAGYSKAYARGNAHKLVAREDVRRYMEWLNENTKRKDIATLEEVKSYWTSTMWNKTERTVDRLRASEMLAKSMGAFSDDW